jgi:hypothetical protein
VTVKALLALVLVLAALATSAAERPAVLFVGGVHATYVAQPLDALGLALDRCSEAELPARLATGQYAVVVTDTHAAPAWAALDAFLAAGGGVIACQPRSYPDEARWTASCEWLAKQGAKPRWEMFQDSDAANVVRDLMGSQLSFSTAIEPAFAAGVPSLLILTARSTTGWEPPMSWDLAPDWQIVARGAASLKSVPDPRNDVALKPWLPAAGIASAPPVAAVRQVGTGRLAVIAPRYYWLFAPPPNCPTVEAMLTAGAGGRASHWLALVANLARHLAAPTLASRPAFTTPDAILHPPPQVWEKTPPYDWSKDVADWTAQPQQQGLIGARTALSTGRGTVSDYVRAAKAAGLQYVVFLEDSLQLDQAKWDQLVADCAAASDAAFLAVPGLTYADAQGNHLYAFSDNVRLPKPEMLLADKRLATVQSMRSRAYFDYDNEYLGQKAIRGFWYHRANFLHIADYKLYNSFPIMSFQDGEEMDNHLAEFLYLQGIGGCQAPLAFELMSGPEQVAPRAREGWRTVVTRPLAELREQWHRGAFSFSGSGSQYITNGPQILVWQAPNRLADPRGEWWRPDLWQFRIRLKVTASAGLRSVTIHDGDRRVLRRWLPGGATEFQQELAMSNCQQYAPTLVVEDEQGRRAVSAAFYMRNLVKEEFFCSDRCNTLGNSRLRGREGNQTWTPVGFQANMGITPSKGKLDLRISPAVSLTPNAPTLPIDGAPAGLPAPELYFGPTLPGEHEFVFAYPRTWLVSTEIAAGQADWTLAYDPAEKGATATPLGHPYANPKEQHGWGNAWGSWHRLVPTRMAEGFVRTWAGNWIPGTVRAGAHQVQLKLKEPLTLPADRPRIAVMRGSGDGWQLFRGGEPVPLPAQGNLVAPFARGTVALRLHPNGAVMVIGFGGPLEATLDPKGNFSLAYVAPQAELPAGTDLSYLVAFAGAPGSITAEQFLAWATGVGVTHPGQAAYQPKLTRGRTEDTFLSWSVAAAEGAATGDFPRADLNGFLTTVVGGLNDRWTAWLAWGDGARRAIPVRDGLGFAALDPLEHHGALFLGHPIVADQPELAIEVCETQPGQFQIEAHNPTDRPLGATLFSNLPPAVLPFPAQTIELAPGTSQFWHLPARR